MGPKKPTVHVVTIAINEPYTTTQRLLNDSIERHTSYPIVKHAYSRVDMERSPWFSIIRDFPTFPTHMGKRDGYYCCYKQLVAADVYFNMADGDVVYYVDSSQHFRNGFTENLDKFFDLAVAAGGIHGSFGTDVMNKPGQCDMRSCWDACGLGDQYDAHVGRPHVLASWFVMPKTPANTAVMQDYVDFTKVRLPSGEPVGIQHHVGDQALYNLVVVKHRLRSFHLDGVGHSDNKDRNLVCRVLNADPETDLPALERKYLAF